MKYIKRILIFGFIFNPCLSKAQDNFGFNFIFLTWHFGGDEMAQLQPNKLDSKATLVPNWGGVAHYERFIYKRRFSLKLVTGAYSDCARLFAGHTHIAFRWNAIQSERHDLRLGFGPTWVYRQSWHRFPGYIQNIPYFRTKGNWQTAFVWYGGEIEYDYKLNDNWNINFHVIPGIPDFTVFGVGFRYWLRPIPSNKFWKHNPNKKKWFYTTSDLQN